MLDQHTQKNEMEIGNENSIFTGREMGRLFFAIRQFFAILHSLRRVCGPSVVAHVVVPSK